ELMSRLEALLRRAYGDLSDAAGGRVIRHGDLVIDLERRRVQRGDRRISLTPTEFEILRHLATRPGRVYTRSELLDLLRDYEALDQDEKTINVHVSHLRDKLEDDPANPAFVQTIRGAGAATLALVGILVVNRVGAYFDQQQQDELRARAGGVAQYVILVAESTSSSRAGRPVVDADNVVDPVVFLELSRSTQQQFLADSL